MLPQVLAFPFRQSKCSRCYVLDPLHEPRVHRRGGHALPPAQPRGHRYDAHHRDC